MGFDAFGLPAEQHAVQTGTHPAVTTEANINTFRRQLKMLGFSYDWSREINTTDPGYVKFTQWIFLTLFKRGLAYQDEITVNWCAELGTVLANEEIVDGKSERGGHPVTRVPLRQWMLRITEYADTLLDGLEGIDWPESTLSMQREWIGRSEGATVFFEVPGNEKGLSVYTTRPDTLFGVSFMVVAPEHPIVEQLITDDTRSEVEAYRERTKALSDRDRQQAKEKTGVFSGGFARHPLSGEEIPIWIADYVLMGYGTGAIMAVPAHDARDWAFAKKYDLPIKQVVAQKNNVAPLEEAFSGEGVAINSGSYDGLETAAFKEKVIADLVAQNKGEATTNFKLRDWVFSRQRYWGEPIPIYFPVETKGDPRAGDDFTIDYNTPLAVSDDELPLTLPELEDYRPGDDPAGVLARVKAWRFFQKQDENGNLKWFARETNTMPQWAGSCWYYLRYLDPHNEKEAWAKTQADKWLPVDLYVGGAEHAVLHLLYARFWHKVLYDAGYVGCPEPFTKLVHQGMILGPVEYAVFERADGTYVSQNAAKRSGNDWLDAKGQCLTLKKLEPEQVEPEKGGRFVLKVDKSITVEARAHKMSKSRGNVVSPDDVVNKFGADTLRLYEMFMGPLEATKPWNTQAISGVRRFLDRAYALSEECGRASGDRRLRKDAT